jgi:hypothetical protein
MNFQVKQQDKDQYSAQEMGAPIGATVQYYGDGYRAEVDPRAAIVTRSQLGMLLDLAIIHRGGGDMGSVRTVRFLGDPELINEGQRKKGAWGFVPCSNCCLDQPLDEPTASHEEEAETTETTVVQPSEGITDEVAEKIIAFEAEGLSFDQIHPRVRGYSVTKNELKAFLEGKNGGPSD